MDYHNSFEKMCEELISLRRLYHKLFNLTFGRFDPVAIMIKELLFEAGHIKKKKDKKTGRLLYVW